jgi:hypothetical protein
MVCQMAQRNTCARVHASHLLTKFVLQSLSWQVSGGKILKEQWMWNLKFHFRVHRKYVSFLLSLTRIIQFTKTYFNINPPYKPTCLSRISLSVFPSKCVRITWFPSACYMHRLSHITSCVLDIDICNIIYSYINSRLNSGHSCEIHRRFNVFRQIIQV